MHGSSPNASKETKAETSMDVARSAAHDLLIKGIPLYLVFWGFIISVVGHFDFHLAVITAIGAVCFSVGVWFTVPKLLKVVKDYMDSAPPRRN